MSSENSISQEGNSDSKVTLSKEEKDEENGSSSSRKVADDNGNEERDLPEIVKKIEKIRCEEEKFSISCLAELNSRGIEWSQLEKWETFEIERESFPTVQRIEGFNNTENCSSGSGGREITERVGHSLVPLYKKKKLMLIGGANPTTDLKEIWSIDYEDSKFIVSKHPASEDFLACYEFLAAHDSDNDNVWLFGGCGVNEGPKSDVHLFDGGKEILTVKYDGTEKINCSNEKQRSDRGGGNEKTFLPSGRTQGNNSCFLKVGKKKFLAIYGGGFKEEKSVQDGSLYLYETESGEWSIATVKGDKPPPRQGHFMVSIGSKIFIHGGMDKMDFYSDIYMIDISSEDSNNPSSSWMKIDAKNIPEARAAHGAVVRGDEIFMFGGFSSNGAFSDFWKFHTGSLEWSRIITKHNPQPRLDFAMALIPLDKDTGGGDSKGPEEKSDVIVLHGGMNSLGEIFNDFWFIPLS